MYTRVRETIVNPREIFSSVKTRRSITDADIVSAMSALTFYKLYKNTKYKYRFVSDYLSLR